MYAECSDRDWVLANDSDDFFYGCSCRLAESLALEELPSGYYAISKERGFLTSYRDEKCLGRGVYVSSISGAGVNLQIL